MAIANIERWGENRKPTRVKEEAENQARRTRREQCLGSLQNRACPEGRSDLHSKVLIRE